jgi:hypothetical protein
MKTKVKKGDKIIYHKSSQTSKGGATWVVGMNRFIEKELTVKEVHGSGGILIEGSPYRFPDIGYEIVIPKIVNSTSINISIPEGYEIDEDKSTPYTNIVFKKKKPLSPHLRYDKPGWDCFGEVEGYYVDSDTDIVYSSLFDSEMQSTKNIFPIEEEAEACLALSQLLQWRNYYNNGWTADWTDFNYKYIITVQASTIRLSTSVGFQHVLSFKSSRVRDKFLKDFKDLINVAKPLL